MRNIQRPRRDFAALEARRMAAARLFAQGHRQAEVARRLDVSRQTTSRWYQAWRQKGRSGLKGAGRAGRKPRLESSALKRVEAALLRGAEAWGFRTHLWTLERVAHVIWKTCHVQYSLPQTWRILGQLGWSRQRPARRAKERNERAITRWKKLHWPRIKKKPSG